MPDSLKPSYEAIMTIKGSIQNAPTLEMGPERYSAAIAPLLSLVNQWSTQIPLLLTEVGPNTSINLVFAIRKELYIGPQFTQRIFRLSPAALLLAFQEFQDFIHKLIKAQKVKQPAVTTSLVCFILHKQR
jgi:hypothetical protein